MARPRIVQKPLPFQPKSCIITGRGDGDIVDFGVDSTYAGPEPHIYIKRSEVEKAGKVCGMLSEDEVESLQSERDELIARNAELIAEIKVSKLQQQSELHTTALAAASIAAQTVIQHNPEAECPVEAIQAAVEELFPKEEIPA